MRNITQYVLHPSRIIGSYKLRQHEKILPDKLYLKCMYSATMKKKLHLNPPVLYNEKIQWLKLNDFKPEYVKMADKYEVKLYVKERIGGEHIVPNYGVWDRFEDIDFDALPNEFVLKCTHDSASYVICKDKNKFDYNSAKEKISRCLARDFFSIGREKQYKYVKPRIIAEKYLEDHKYHELRDYKVFTFNSVPKIMHIVSNRQNVNEPTYGDFFDMDYNHLDLTMGHDQAPVPPEKPVNFDKMREFAGVLSKDIPHCRVDFYEVDGKLYFGELTFRQDSGFADVKPDRWNKILGDWIDISNVV